MNKCNQSQSQNDSNIFVRIRNRKKILFNSDWNGPQIHEK